MAPGPRILLVSVRDEIRSWVTRLATNVDWLELEADLDKLFEPLERMPALVVCGIPPEATPLEELAQVLRMQYQKQKIFLVVDQGHGTDKRTLKKNGFDDVFFLPLDEAILLRSVNEALARANVDVKVYRAVQLADLQPGVVLDFDTYLYLPANGKYLKFSNAGEEIDSGQFERLNTGVKRSIHISISDVDTFVDYSARRLREIQGSDTMSATEKNERLKTAIRGIFGDLFSGGSTATSAGKQIVEDCQKVLAQYIGLTSPGSWYQKILAVSSQESDVYSRSGNSATYAGLFSIALGLGAEEVTVAALLHDVGLAKVPADVLAKSEGEWTPVERSLYQAHPEHSIRIIQDRKLVLTDKVYQIIAQHHETWSGTGYPKGLRGNRICPEAQILAMADEFDALTSIRSGVRTLTPLDAMRKMDEDERSRPGAERYDRELLSRLSGLFRPD